jgi:hypothetical protein
MARRHHPKRKHIGFCGKGVHLDFGGSGALDAIGGLEQTQEIQSKFEIVGRSTTMEKGCESDDFARQKKRKLA